MNILSIAFPQTLLPYSQLFYLKQQQQKAKLTLHDAFSFGNTTTSSHSHSTRQLCRRCHESGTSETLQHPTPEELCSTLAGSAQEVFRGEVLPGLTCVLHLQKLTLLIE